MTEKKKIPIQDGIFTMPADPAEQPHLIGTKCRSCQEIMWEKKQICMNCQSEDVEEVALSTRGKLWGFTCLHYKSLPPYRAPDPYIPIIAGFVELPEKVRVLSLLTDCDFHELEIGMEMELVLGKAYEDEEGNEVVVHKFRPIRTS